MLSKSVSPENQEQKATPRMIYSAQESARWEYRRCSLLTETAVVFTANRKWKIYKEHMGVLL